MSRLYGRTPPTMNALLSCTLSPSTDRMEILWSPSRVTRALLPSGVNATWLGPDLGSLRSILPAGVSLLPATVKTEIVPSLRLATRTNVPALLIDTPAAPRPASRVAITAGGFAFRSITDSLLSGTAFFGSVGSILKAPVTSAKLSSRDTATLCGGPTTLAGALTSPITLGGEEPRSTMLTVSAVGLSGTTLAPLTNMALLSFAETAICAVAPIVNTGSMASAKQSFAGRQK